MCGQKSKKENVPAEKWLKWVKVVTDNTFSFLDMRISWTAGGDLQINVYNKKKQAIKYVDKGSTHHPCMFKSITSGVYTHLGCLTSKTPEHANLRVDELYPHHTEALLTSNLEPVEFPKLSKIWKKEEETKVKLNEKQVSSSGKDSSAN
eukprot:14125642-Ditylum_brightwellii.AAC.1